MGSKTFIDGVENLTTRMIMMMMMITPSQSDPNKAEFLDPYWFSLHMHTENERHKDSIEIL
eukprot:6609406-Karenia_brevis.AAC.1